MSTVDQRPIAHSLSKRDQLFISLDARRNHAFVSVSWPILGIQSFEV